MRTLRFVFCILSCLCLAASIPVGAIFDWMWFVILAGAAALFAILMVWCKNSSEPKAPPAPDFMNTPEENAKRREALEEYHREHDDNRS